ncbi:MAG: signal peptidase II [Paracoccaceae bacterium]
MRLAIKVAAATFLVDQISKYAVVHLMRLDNLKAIDVLPPYLNLRMAWNQGVNFGLFSNGSDLGRWLLILLALVISAWVWRWVSEGDLGKWAHVSAGLLIGGALGNVLDRLIYGAVADFLNMSCCGIDNPYSFNVADIAIFAGALGLVAFGGKPGNGGAAA